MNERDCTIYALLCGVYTEGIAVLRLVPQMLPGDLCGCSVYVHVCVLFITSVAAHFYHFG